MDVSFNTLCNYFPKDQIKIYNKNNTDIIFDDVKFITNKQKNFLNNIIYIGKVSMIHHKFKEIQGVSLILINDENIPLDDMSLDSISVIELNDSEDIFDIFNSVKDLFTEDINDSKNTTALLKSIITGEGLDYIVKVATEILDNPVVVIDTSYKVLSYPEIEKITDRFWIDNIKRGYCSYDFIVEVKRLKSVQQGMKANVPFEVVCEQSPIGRMVTKIEIDNKHVGNLILLACNREFLPKDIELLSLTSKIIAEEMKKSSLYRNPNNVEYEDVICDFLEGNIDSREVLEERIKSLNIRFKKNIRILVFDIKKYSSIGKNTGYLSNKLNYYFPLKKLVYYDDNIVIINDYDTDDIDIDSLNKINPFLSENKILLGMSNVFNDMLMCSHFYKQAVNAIRIGEKLNPDNYINFYSDIQFYDLIAATREYIDYRDFYHPALIKLKDYDEENNTELFDTLIVYIKNNQSLQKTSQELFIHRNTMTYRIQKIMNIINMDISDNEVIFNIYMSYKIMNYFEKIN